MLRQIYFAVIVVCLMVPHINAAVFSLGKCVAGTLLGAEMPLEQVTVSQRWDTIYATNTPEMYYIDHGFDIFSHNRSGVYISYYEIVTILTLRQSYSCEVSDGYSDNYFIKKCWDGDGNVVMIRIYILYFKQGKIAYTYFCNDSDVPGHTINADIRFICVTGGHIMTEEEKQEIFALDASIFGGSLYKFPSLLP